MTSSIKSPKNERSFSLVSEVAPSGLPRVVVMPKIVASLILALLDSLRATLASGPVQRPNFS